MNKILIVTYYWPPSAGSGVQRWLKMSKCLADLGWDIYIYTPENPDFNLKDDSLMSDVHPKLKVIKSKIWEPYHLSNWFSKKKQNTGIVQRSEKQSTKQLILNWIRGNLFIPDPRKFWIEPSIKLLTALIKKHEIDYLITTGPPHSMHLIGAGVKKKIDISWIMDIRDPWSKLDFLDTFRVSSYARRKYQNLEQNCLNKADAVIGTSYSMPKLLMPFDHDKYTTITNGFDDDDFLNSGDRKLKKNKEIKIYYAGLLNQLRFPLKFIDMLSALTDKWKATDNPTVITLHLVGSIDNEIIKYVNTKAKNLNLIQEPYKSHDLVLADYRQADILLLLVNNSHNSLVNIPGKLFEYIASKRKIVAFGKPTDDAIEIVLENGGLCFNYQEVIDLSTFESFLSKEIEYKKDQIYSRKAQSMKLVNEVFSALKKKINK